jgi:hypothetical protein
VLKTDPNLDEATKIYPNLGNALTFILEKNVYSVTIGQEATVALRLFTRKQENLIHISKESIGKILSAYSEC